MTKKALEKAGWREERVEAALAAVPFVNLSDAVCRNCVRGRTKDGAFDTVARFLRSKARFPPLHSPVFHENPPQIAPSPPTDLVGRMHPQHPPKTAETPPLRPV